MIPCYSGMKDNGIKLLKIFSNKSNWKNNKKPKFSAYIPWNKSVTHKSHFSHQINPFNADSLYVADGVLRQQPNTAYSQKRYNGILVRYQEVHEHWSDNNNI